MDTIEERLHMLAQSHKRWRAATLLLSLVVLAALAMGQARPVLQTVAAEKFVLKDRQGHEWATLGMAANGEPALVFSDDKGQPRASMGITPDGAASLMLYDGAGQARVDIGVGKAGEPNLVMLDARGKMRIFSGVQKDDTPLLTFFDADERPQYRLGRLPNSDRVGLSFIGNGRASVGLAAAGLIMFDEKGTPTITLGARDDGSALTISDAKGEVRAGIGVKPDGSGSLHVVGRDGKTIVDVLPQASDR